MKILMHGALTGSNFGDCLYAQMYAEYLRSISDDIEVLFWKNRSFGASRHVVKLCNSKVTKSLETIDGLVYMPGGYFSQTSNPQKRIKRYFELGEKCLRLNKDILISAVGGEIVRDKVFSDTVAPIVQKASLVSVRNQQTFNTFKTAFGVEPIKLSDVILQAKYSKLSELPSNIIETINHCKQTNKKILFLHVHGRNKHNALFEEKIIPYLNKFLKDKNVHIIIGTDYIPRIWFKNISKLNIYKKIDASKSVYIYKKPLELCALLKQCDIVVTPKLHVGVISAVYGKSVLSFAVNYTKTSEFYKEIGCSERCISLSCADEHSVLNNFEKYANIPIEIPSELFDLSKKNLTLLKEEILKMKEKISYQG